MATYSVRAITKAGSATTVRQDAANEQELAEKLARSGMQVARILSVTDHASEARPGAPLRRRSLAEFTDRLQILYGAGIPIVDAMDEIMRGASDARLRAICAQIRFDISDGTKLCDCLARFPRAFPPWYLAAVKAGEDSGTLEEVLERLVDQIDWQQSIRLTVIQTFTYPAILATAVFGLVIFMFTFLLPRLTDVYEKAGVSLPKPTLVLIGISDFLRTNGPSLLAGLVALVVLFRLARRYDPTREAIDRFYLRLPVIGELLRKASSATFISTLRTLHRAGTPMLSALELSKESVNNHALSRDIDGVSRLVSEGVPLSEAFEHTREIDPLVPRMVSVGERSGALTEALEHVMKLYDREVKAATKRLVTFLEPAILVMAGGMVGFIVVATLLPMFRMISAVKQ